MPTSGKSTYCRRLEEKHGVIHFDMDHKQFQGTGADQQWEHIFRPTGAVQPLLATLRP
jgi:hypothetical protein